MRRWNSEANLDLSLPARRGVLVYGKTATQAQLLGQMRSRKRIWPRQGGVSPEEEGPISKNQEPKDLFFDWFLEFGSWFFVGVAWETPHGGGTGRLRRHCPVFG